MSRPWCYKHTNPIGVVLTPSVGLYLLVFFLIRDGVSYIMWLRFENKTHPVSPTPPDQRGPRRGERGEGQP